LKTAIAARREKQRMALRDRHLAQEIAASREIELLQELDRFVAFSLGICCAILPALGTYESGCVAGGRGRKWLPGRTRPFLT
jgi:hypothetical protein